MTALKSPHRWDTSRVEAFSDGVFAIAITLLVLDIRVEPAQYENLGKALLDEWPAYLAYVTSFLTVGSVWIAHHNLYSHLRFVDPVLLRLNLPLLLAAAFLPFPTGVLAQSFDASDDAERTAIILYGADRARNRAAAAHRSPLRALTARAHRRAAGQDAGGVGTQAELARGGDRRVLRTRDPGRRLHLPEAAPLRTSWSRSAACWS